MVPGTPNRSVRGARHVPDGDAPFGPGPLHLGEIHTQLISLLPGGVRDVQVLPGCVLSLLGGLARSVLGTLRSLAGLIGDLPCSALGLLGSPPSGVLSLLGDSSSGVLDALGGLPGLICHLARGLLGLLGRLVYRVVESLVMGRLVESALDLRVGVDHLLQLRLRLRRGLLHQALELGAFALQLTLEPAERVAIEVLGALHDLLLYPLLEGLCFAHSFSFLVIFSDAWTLSVSFRILSTTLQQGICRSTTFAAPRKLGPCRPAPADPETANLRRSPRRR